jgi:hypothetical protein
MDGRHYGNGAGWQARQWWRLFLARWLLRRPCLRNILLSIDERLRWEYAAIQQAAVAA